MRYRSLAELSRCCNLREPETRIKSEQKTEEKNWAIDDLDH